MTAMFICLKIAYLLPRNLKKKIPESFKRSIKGKHLQKWLKTFLQSSWGIVIILI